jgi:NAD(P)-dependent dehydrogenase (short-subunit alcohol dehydrogenase family)
MQLNYFGSLRLIMGLLPGMAQRHRGHIINISSIGVLTNAPCFSAYVASKAALDAFSCCAQAEFSDNAINFTTVNMPLVKTPMIAPTKMYDSLPTWSSDEAADFIVEAIVERPVRLATRLGTFAQIFYAIAPRAAFSGEAWMPNGNAPGMAVACVQIDGRNPLSPRGRGVGRGGERSELLLLVVATAACRRQPLIRPVFD